MQIEQVPEEQRKQIREAINSVDIKSLKEIKIPLEYGVKVDGKLVKELVVKLPMEFGIVRSFLNKEHPEDVRVEGLLVKLFNIPPSEVAKIIYQDVADILDTLTPFLLTSQQRARV